MSTENNKFVKVLELEDEFEAGLIKTELDKEDIPYEIISNYDYGFDGIYQFQHGWGILKAPGKYSDKIIEIYKDLKNND
ncbi:MAG: hypothetical protein ABR596_04920 [Halarsenatibacteraceae bacterium]